MGGWFRLEIPDPREQVPNLTDDIGLFLVAMAVFFVVDMALRRYGPLADTFSKSGKLLKRNQYRYFAIHILANLYVTIIHMPDVIAVYADPVYNYAARTNTKGMCVTVAVHVYHVLAFQPLPVIDWVHHVIMVFFMAPLAYAAAPGPLLGHGNFYISGLPGMLDYILLVGIACGFVDRLTEKRYNAVIQSWIRMPGTMVHAVLGYICYIDSATRLIDGISIKERALFPYIGLSTFVTAATFYWNGIYFQNRVVANTAIAEYEHKRGTASSRPAGTLASTCADVYDDAAPMPDTASRTTAPTTTVTRRAAKRSGSDGTNEASTNGSKGSTRGPAAATSAMAATGGARLAALLGGGIASLGKTSCR